MKRSVLEELFIATLMVVTIILAFAGVFLIVYGFTSLVLGSK